MGSPPQIGTHAAFNGSLLVLALVHFYGPAHVVAKAGVALTVPGGWVQVDAGVPSVPGQQVTGLMLVGPAAAQFGVMSLSLPPRAGLTLDALEEMTGAGQMMLGSDVKLRHGDYGRVMLPYGEALKMRVEFKGQRGTLFYLLRGGALWTLVATTAGDEGARADAESMLAGLRFYASAPGEPAPSAGAVLATRESCGAACDLGST